MKRRKKSILTEDVQRPPEMATSEKKETSHKSGEKSGRWSSTFSHLILLNTRRYTINFSICTLVHTAKLFNFFWIRRRCDSLFLLLWLLRWLRWRPLSFFPPILNACSQNFYVAFEFFSRTKLMISFACVRMIFFLIYYQNWWFFAFVNFCLVSNLDHRKWDFMLVNNSNRTISITLSYTVISLFLILFVFWSLEIFVRKMKRERERKSQKKKHNRKLYDYEEEWGEKNNMNFVRIVFGRRMSYTLKSEWTIAVRRPWREEK